MHAISVDARRPDATARGVDAITLGVAAVWILWQAWVAKTLATCTNSEVHVVIEQLAIGEKVVSAFGSRTASGWVKCVLEISLMWLWAHGVDPFAPLSLAVLAAIAAVAAQIRHTRHSLTVLGANVTHKLFRMTMHSPSGHSLRGHPILVAAGCVAWACAWVRLVRHQGSPRASQFATAAFFVLHRLTFSAASLGDLFVAWLWAAALLL